MRSGKKLNERWAVGAKHALYRASGDWYHTLAEFPGALFDANGYVLFTSEEEYRNCPNLKFGKDVHVPEGIRRIPGYVHVDDSTDEIAEDIRTIAEDTTITDTQKSQLIQSRIGQGAFRRQLVEAWGGCSVTGCACVSLLIASHIKPWRVSDNAERLDPFNGLLLLPNIDRAFDKGRISFDQTGKILISSDFPEFQDFGLNFTLEIKVQEQHLPYFKYHRDYVYRKA